MRQNPLGNAFTFLTDATTWTTPVFWLLLLGSIAIAVLAWRGDPAQRSVWHVGRWLLRVTIGSMWWQQSLWKIPPHYDWGLIHWMQEMVTTPRSRCKTTSCATSCCQTSRGSDRWAT